MAKMTKAFLGIGIGKEERQARREDRKLRKEVCRGGKCGGRAKGYIGYNKDGGKVKKALFGDKEERQARRAERQSNREMRRADRQSMRMSRDNANPYKRCRGGNCGSRNIGVRLVGYKNGGSFDLNKDGKTTFKDVLIGRGVLPKTAKKGMKIKRAKNGDPIKYTTPSGNKVTADTTGYAAGKKRFPIKVERTTGQTQYGTSGRKSIGRSIASSQGKPYKKQTISSVGTKKAKKVLAPKSKHGSKISKKK